MTKLTFEEWIEKYKPIINNENAPYNGYGFETYGKELEKVLQIIKNEQYNFVWTLVSVNNEEVFIIPGYHFVDRMLYFITEIPWEDKNIEIDLNDYISPNQAKDACIDFWQTQGFIFNNNVINDWFERKRNYSIGEAKYQAIEFYENETNSEITSQQEDEIHNFYSQLI